MLLSLGRLLCLVWIMGGDGDYCLRVREIFGFELMFFGVFVYPLIRFLFCSPSLFHYIETITLLF